MDVTFTSNSTGEGKSQVRDKQQGGNFLWGDASEEYIAEVDWTRKRRGENPFVIHHPQGKEASARGICERWILQACGLEMLRTDRKRAIARDLACNPISSRHEKACFQVCLIHNQTRSFSCRTSLRSLLFLHSRSPFACKPCER